MMNLLKSMLTNITDDPKTSLPNRDREGAVLREWAIARGDKSRAVESHFSDVSSPEGRAATFLIGEVSASGARTATLVNLIQSAFRSADQEAAAFEINRMRFDHDRHPPTSCSQ